ncbi:MAG: hypothetical protein MI864_16335 [Pseudomonadales bacterium]|nr:hypothetical protein [Pseudomonadales bacterium]
MEPISKTEFKARALEVLRDIEQSGQRKTLNRKHAHLQCHAAALWPKCLADDC